MAELKTRPGDQPVTDFLAEIEPVQKREDAQTLCALMQELTGQPPVIWGGKMVGFGSYRYLYPTGNQGEWFEVGFAPRKQNLTLYIMPGFEAYPELMAKLGKYKTGKSCLYVKRLADIDLQVLSELIIASLQTLRERYPQSE